MYLNTFISDAFGERSYRTHLTKSRCSPWLLGLIPSFIAYKKGRNFYNWWMYGHLLFIVALLHALLLRETEDSLIHTGVLKKCPYCAEVVKKEAKVCKHCGNHLDWRYNFNFCTR